MTLPTLTLETILTLEANATTDALVAETLGWYGLRINGVAVGMSPEHVGAVVPSYSADVKASLGLVAKTWCYVDLTPFGARATIRQNIHGCLAEANTPALAIVRAWLASKWHEARATA